MGMLQTSHNSHAIYFTPGSTPAPSAPHDVANTRRRRPNFFWRLFSTPERPWGSVLIKEVTEDDWSDASSVASDALSDEEDSLTLYDPSQETFSERFYALKDMVPPSTRASIVDSIDKVRGWTKWSVGKVGQAAWITTTSALLVGLPLLLSIEGEAAIVQQEKEFLAQPGAPNPYGAPPAPGSAPAPQGVVPAGF
ncbi:hypothetical protein JCM11641_001196 [Rhodosporidiobolus odoratus]